MAAKKILWIEDNEDILIAFKIMLEEEGDWEVHTATSVEEGEKIADTLLPDLIIMDIMLGATHGFSGIEGLSFSAE